MEIICLILIAIIATIIIISLKEFKKNIDGMQFYVKVKIVQENGEDILKCIGFHEDDFA